MEPIKLTEEELNKFAEFNQKNNDLVYKLGNLDLTKVQIEERRKELLAFFIQLKEDDAVFSQELTTKYGDGNINFQTGEFIPFDNSIED